MSSPAPKTPSSSSLFTPNIILLIAIFFDLLAVAFVIPLLPQFAKRLNVGPSLMGVLGSVYGFTQLVGAPYMGRISDTKGRVYVLLLSCICSCVSYVLMGAAGSIVVLFISRSVIGFAKQTTTAAQAYISDTSSAGNDRNVWFGRITLVISVAFIIGPAIGGRLSRHSLALPTIAAAVCFVIEYILIYVWLPEPRRPTISPTTPSSSSSSSSSMSSQFSVLKTYFQRHSMRRLLITITIVYFTMMMYQSLYATALQERFQLDTESSGYLWAYAGAWSAFAQGVLVPMSREWDDSVLVVWSVGALGVSYIGMGTMMSLYAWCCVYPVNAIAQGMLRTTLTATATKIVEPTEVGTTLGVIGSVASLMRVIAPTLGGIVMDYVGAAGLDIFSGLLLCSFFGFMQYCSLSAPLGDKKCQWFALERPKPVVLERRKL